MFTHIPRFFVSEDLELRINNMNITNYIKLFRGMKKCTTYVHRENN